MNYIWILLISCYSISVLSTSAIEPTPNFCINCKHFRYDVFSSKQFGKCALFPIVEEKNRYYLVNGEQDNKPTDYNYCSIVRNYNDMCGTEGKFFESKPVFISFANMRNFGKKK